jgi:hypothetical protein
MFRPSEDDPKTAMIIWEKGNHTFVQKVTDALTGGGHEITYVCNGQRLAQPLLLDRSDAHVVGLGDVARRARGQGGRSKVYNVCAVYVGRPFKSSLVSIMASNNTELPPKFRICPQKDTPAKKSIKCIAINIEYLSNDDDQVNFGGSFDEDATPIAVGSTFQGNATSSNRRDVNYDDQSVRQVSSDSYSDYAMHYGRGHRLPNTHYGNGNGRIRVNSRQVSSHSYRGREMHSDGDGRHRVSTTRNGYSGVNSRQVSSLSYREPEGPTSSLSRNYNYDNGPRQGVGVDRSENEATPQITNTVSTSANEFTYSEASSSQLHYPTQPNYGGELYRDSRSRHSNGGDGGSRSPYSQDNRFEVNSDDHSAHYSNYDDSTMMDGENVRYQSAHYRQSSPGASFAQASAQRSPHRGAPLPLEVHENDHNGLSDEELTLNTTGDRGRHRSTHHRGGRERSARGATTVSLSMSGEESIREIINDDGHRRSVDHIEAAMTMMGMR